MSAALKKTILFEPDAAVVPTGSGVRDRVAPLAVAEANERSTVRAPDFIDVVERPTAPAPAAERRLVLLVNGSPLAWAYLDRAVPAEARVVATSSVPAIHEALRRTSAPVQVVLDCRHAVDEALLSHLVPELPHGSRVVLWGTPDRVAALLSQVPGSFSAWTHFTGEAADVAAMVGEELGGAA